MCKDIADLADQWERASEELAFWKSKEAALRRDLFAAAFESPKEGTQYATLPNKTRLKAVQRYTREFSQADALEVSVRLSEEGYDPDTVFPLKAELKLSGLKALSDEARGMVESILTIKPSSVLLELLEDSENEQ